MEDLLKQLLLSQMQAALCTLNVCVTRCPDDLWDERVVELTINQAVVHALFFVDCYLSPSEDQDAFKQQPFHRAESAAFRDYEEFEPRRQVHGYDRPFVARYMQHCRQKAIDVITGETAATLAGPSGFSWRKCPRAELHVYNTRHIQHHAAQISLRLRLNAGVDVPWISHGWKEV